jgi:hypothetical protein
MSQCPAEIWAVAWFQNFLELVYGEGRERGLKWGQARLIERKEISWNPAEMEET